jgi:hypothetical protein
MLEEVGFSRPQAETSIQIMVDSMDEKFATKQDLEDLDLRVERRFDQIEHRLLELESRLTIKMGTMLAASIAILTAIQKLT